MSAARAARRTARTAPLLEAPATCPPPARRPNLQQPGGTGAAAGPDGAVAGGSRGTSHGRYRRPAELRGDGRGTYHGAAAYSTAHTALPTDAGYGLPGSQNRFDRLRGLSPDRGGQRQRLRRPRRRRPNSLTATACMAKLACGPSGAWSAAGWTAGHAWTPATWPAVGASLGWAAGVQPFAYNYGTDITYQDDQVYYGGQPVATAEQYYQQASTLAQSAPRHRSAIGRLDASGRVRIGPERAVRPALRDAIGRQ